MSRFRRSPLARSIRRTAARSGTLGVHERKFALPRARMCNDSFG